MTQSNESKKNYFYIDRIKLGELMKKKKVSGKDISEHLNHNRRWLSTAICRDKGKIGLAAAQKIAHFLNCTIQEFGKDKEDGEENSRQPYYNPVFLDYQEEAKVRFDCMLKEGRSKDLADVLRFMEESKIHSDYVLSLVSYRSKAWRQDEEQDKKEDEEEDDEKENGWVRVLYASAFARALIDGLDVSDQDIADAYALKKKEIEKKSEARVDKLRKELESLQKRNASEGEIDTCKRKLELELQEVREDEIDATKKVLKNKFSDEIEDIMVSPDFEEKILKECANFLYWFYTLPEAGNYDARINLYKNGELF